MITTRPEETAKIGETLARDLKGQETLRLRSGQAGEHAGAIIVCLYGELGSGKTTFASGFAKGLGIASRLLSPTFIIVRRYQVPNTSGFLYHLDLYRVGGEKDLQGLGISEILADTGSYVLIEWAEKMEKLLPKECLDVHFRVLQDGTHEITIRKSNSAL